MATPDNPKNRPPGAESWKAPGKNTPESEAYEDLLQKEFGAQLKPELLSTRGLGKEFDREVKQFGEAVRGLDQAIQLIVEKSAKNPEVRQALGQLLEEASSLAELKETEINDENEKEMVQLVKNMREAKKKIEQSVRTLKQFENDPEKLAQVLTEIKTILGSNIEVEV